MIVPFKTSEKIYTSPEIAKALGLKVDTVRQYVRRGVLKPLRKIGQTYLFTDSERERYEQERQPAGNPNLSRDN